MIKSGFHTAFWTCACASVISLVACNGSDSSTSPPPSGNTHATLIDACSLLTQAEVEGVFGKAVLTTKQDTSGYITVCTYSGSVDSTYILPTRMQVLAFTNAGIQAQLSPTQSAQTYMANLRSSFPAASWETVLGVGTDAVWLKTGARLSFYKGDVEVDVIYSPHGKALDTSAAARAGEITAGTDIAGRL